MYKPSYRLNPVNSVATLERVLQERATRIRLAAENASKNYRQIVIKKGQKSRTCWDPSPPLRRLQTRIVSQLLRRVIYPKYLHGGLPGRDYLTNAESHLRARWGYCGDIENFFPSITRPQVFDLWREFFGFAPEVSGLLTDLTTLNGAVPQGSLTASYIANLVLWKSEWKVAKALEQAGFAYTRFIDDITITTQRQQSSLELTKNVTKIHRLADSNDFQIKRSKSKILNSQNAKLVLGIDVSSFSAKRSRRQRKLLTSEVMSAAGKVAGMDRDLEAKKYLNKLRGRLTELRRFSPEEADRLLMICPRPK